MMTGRHLHLAVALDGAGWHPAAWREPGARPTELFTAHRAGAPLVKLFPATAVGPAYLTYLRGPLPDVRIMPTGGLTPDTALDWIRAGAAAVGLGGSLCPRTMAEVEDAARAAADLLRRIDGERGR